MNKIIIVMAGYVTLLIGTALAQDHEEVNKAMKTAGAATGSLRKTIAAKDSSETAATAETLAAAFKIIQAHFEEHHMEDGIKFSQTGNKASINLAAAAKAGEWEKASDELKTIGAQCQGCHAAHREKLPDGTYKMK
jgi:Pyruvate/2-oxoacid:ferredoxin oxidoreductase gamma subunit